MKGLTSPTESRRLKLGPSRRKRMSLSGENLIKTSLLDPSRKLPLVIEPAVDGVDLVSWAEGQRELLGAWLVEYGGLLFRNFNVSSEEEFENFIGATSGSALEYKERSSPRSQVSGNIYTSTDHPPNQSIFLHNEHSYSRVYPLRIFFYCKIPAAKGGETPVADCRRMASRLSPGIRRKFEEKGYAYVRNFGDGFGLSWQTAFQTEDRATVEGYCATALIEYEWKAGDRLRTRQVRPAIIDHPETQDKVWFNHITFFHVTTLEPEIRDGLLAQFAEEDLPNNTYYGDDTPIEPEVLEELRSIYNTEKVVFPWQKGDVLMLDNVLTAHAREPFEGERKVLVGMAHPVERTDL